MAVRKIIELGHPKLKAINKEIQDFKSRNLQKLIRDLQDTMRKYELIGIAGPQIGENYKIFATEARNTKYRKLTKEDKFRVFINPKLVKHSKEQIEIYEGCGCTGEICGPVVRSKRIIVEALNETGNKFKITCDGILARVLLHELDHLEGVEFIQKVNDNSRLVIDHAERLRVSRNSKKQIQASKITVLKIENI